MRKFARLVAIIGVVLLGTGMVGAGDGQGGPPFRAGEIVVAGTPDDLPGYDVVKYLPNAKLTVVRVESGKEWGHLQRFRDHGRRAGLNFEAQAFATVNDPYYNPYQWHLSHIQSEQAWDITTGTGAVVAVVDTGLTPGGPDGINCVTAGYDVVNQDNDPADGDGHGTHVSGTIAQRSNNGVAVAGMAHGACVMPVKVLGDDGSGSFADIADGIVWAVDHGADVINMSLGINARYAVTNDPLVDPALDYAYNHGVTVVVASGNDGNRKNVSYPAIYPTCIAVGATDYNNQVVQYSNKGTGLDIVAPGGDTAVDANGDGYTDGVLQETFLDGAWGYYFFQGTSMASPHVAAVAAMLYATNSNITPDQVYAAITGTALDIGDPGFDSASAYGLVQAAAALGGGGGGGDCTDADNDGVCVEDGDCNDSNDAVYPGATELCDGVDNNCDSVVDDGCSTCTDVDGDGVCAEGGDCDDGDNTVYPGATEFCDGLDNNCDGTIDEGCGSACLPAGETCTSNVDCCSLSCHPRKLYCR